MSFPVREEWNLSRPGFWGPVTSTLDWCEANYLFSHYIAEYANTISNLVTIAFGLYGMRTAQQLKLPARYFIQYLSLVAVGLGSFVFHASLLYSAQLSDELPMILSVSCSLFILFDAAGKGETEGDFRILGRTKSRYRLLATVVFDALFAYSYWKFRNPVYHQFVFAVMMLSTTARVTYLTRYSEASTRKLTPETQATIGRLYSTGALMFIFAFLIWNLDNVFCDALSGWKVSMGWPTAFVLEGHAWWHCLTAIGTYYMLNGTTYLTLNIKDDPKKYEVKYSFLLPRLVSADGNKRKA